MKTNFEIDILHSYIEYQDKIIEQLNYHRYILSLSIVEEKIMMTGNLSNYLSDLELEGFNAAKKILEKGDKRLDKVTDEFIYRNYFQIYEEFIASQLYILFKYYPKFIKKDNENIQVLYSSIFDNDSVEEIKNNIIEKKIKELIQSNNIINILKKFKSIFGIDIKLEVEESDFLTIFSLKRNLLTHNNGRVNTIYLNELKKLNIETNLSLNDYVFTNNSEKKVLDNLLKISEKIRKSIIKNENQLNKYHEKIY